MKASFGVSILLLISMGTSGADLLDLLGLGKKSTNQPAATTLASPLSQDEVIRKTTFATLTAIF